MPRPLVGFDLDMTLIDSRRGIGAVYHQLNARYGLDIDVDLVVGRLGPPLQWEIAQWVPEDRVEEMVAAYRALYPEYAIPAVDLLPGAREALAATTPVVITAKNAPQARLHLEYFALDVEHVVGLAWGEGKADALREHRPVAYVGDHTADMAAARSAGVPAIGVTTGHCTADELREAGADLVLQDLTWLDLATLDSLKGPVIRK
ncbi:hydrolase [Longispora fulva]|uniref:Phosphoglycolate phosphatase-like HAD superfamily hydrolase n=1 Tax=Longispora fulva TaxID=619741 RepID=A0A8J7GEE5_9ACTN|nr:HAD hydrolase-like protein [Longispora fulva]MBG6139098.1 phosphoglycolate phosphatase-like HAD superfamily hydrolase [Longispora fulva]GIG58591.1 hydrolase [Longispora fulva]